MKIAHIYNRNTRNTCFLTCFLYFCSELSSDESFTQIISECSKLFSIISIMVLKNGLSCSLHYVHILPQMQNSSLYSPSLNTSSKSYTVLIFPDKTATNVGLSENFLITVGLESSISELISIGFIEKSDFTYSNP